MDDIIIKRIADAIKETRKWLKETEQKMEADAKIDGVDLFPHIMTCSMFSNRIDGLKQALKIVKEESK
jgi:hypothetical protein